MILMIEMYNLVQLSKVCVYTGTIIHLLHLKFSNEEVATVAL